VGGRTFEGGVLAGHYGMHLTTSQLPHYYKLVYAPVCEGLVASMVAS